MAVVRGAHFGWLRMTSQKMTHNTIYTRTTQERWQNFRHLSGWLSSSLCCEKRSTQNYHENGCLNTFATLRQREMKGIGETWKTRRRRKNTHIICLKRKMDERNIFLYIWESICTDESSSLPPFTFLNEILNIKLIIKVTQSEGIHTRRKKEDASKR